jgi:blue copper oxidase
MRTLFSLCFIVFILFFGTTCENAVEKNSLFQSIGMAQTGLAEYENLLPIPPLLKGKNIGKNEVSFDLTVQRGITEFFKGAKVTTYGYNGALLGPTLRAKRGQVVNIQVKNTLREYTTVHWHGMLVFGEMDGGPHQVIPPDGQWNVRFKVNQPAATVWYHPHGLGTTAIQVYKGLAGIFILDDDVSETLNIPKAYGINDIPLVVQDKRFSSDGLPLYLTHMRDIMEGMKGETMLVNGVVNPVLRVSASKYRFRILNGSNARVYLFRLSNGKSFYQIATDASFLEKPVELQSLLLSPGERAEIIVDFSAYNEGEVFYMISEGYDILKFIVGKKNKDTTELPSSLAKIEWLSTDKASQRRHFELEGMGHHVAINRKQMNIGIIDEFARLNAVETWTIRSSTRGMGMMGGGMMRGMRGSSGIFHNFHAHGIHFQIIDRDGRPVAENEKGWKDTVFLLENETARVITRFLYKGLFMYHCHILEHEDNGMMGQFKVE